MLAVTLFYTKASALAFKPEEESFKSLEGLLRLEKAVTATALKEESARSPDF